MTAQTITIDAETTALTIYDTPLAGDDPFEGRWARGEGRLTPDALLLTPD